jgi:peptidoglycan/LPS O-acetylase OafA/YrhL
VPPRFAAPAALGKIDQALQMRQPQIASLTGVRFLAAFSIVIGHVLPISLTVFGTSPHGLTAIGMPLFFTLSGFIIHYSYAHMFAAAPKKAAAEFAFARFSRIYPLYIALLLFWLIFTRMGPQLAATGSPSVLGAYVSATTTWYPFSIDGKILGQWHYGISWSVATEFFFYVCYALFLYRLGRIRSLRRAIIALALFIIVSTAVLSAIMLQCDRWEPWATAVLPQLPSRTQDFDDSFFRWAFYLSPYGQLPAFICGVLTCQIYFLMRQSELKAHRWPDALAWASVAGIALLWIEFQRLGASGHWLHLVDASDIFVALHMNMLFVPLCCGLLLALATQQSMLGRLLATAPVLFFGEVSYSTYLSHPLVIGIVMHFFPWLSTSGLVIMGLSAVAVASALLYRVVEMPTQRLLRRGWLNRAKFFRRAAVATVPTEVDASVGGPKAD